MGRKLIINENQLEVLTNFIQENDVNLKTNVKNVSKYLSKYYEPSYGTHKENGEYHNSVMVLNKVDDELITPKSLLRHLKGKFNLSTEFLIQIIKDWYDGKLDGKFMLSKNVSPS